MSPKLGRSNGSDFVAAFQARGSGATRLSRVQRTPPISSPWPIILLRTLVGVCGFVGLLVCSAYFPAIANPLRVGALVWFFGFGVIQTRFIRGQR